MERDEYDENLRATREALSDGEFEIEWRLGTLMSIERALDEAVQAAKA
jgi:hypothetical protein